MESSILSSPATTSECCSSACAKSPPAPRLDLVQRGLRLEYLTVGWNLIEGVVAVSAALAAGSVAILGFGIDSFVECTAALIMIWRLRAELKGSLSAEHLEQVEHRARRMVAGSLFLLAAFVTVDAAETLWTGDRPSFSAVGVALLSLSITAMMWLARAKRQLAIALGSRAMETDAFQTTACWWLSLTALAGVGLNGLFGWWWADPIAALVLAALIAREGREAWQGKACC